MVCLYRFPFYYQPATFSAVYFEFLDGTHHKKQINLHLQASWAYRAPVPHVCWGNWVILLHSVLSLSGVGG